MSQSAATALVAVATAAAGGREARDYGRSNSGDDPEKDIRKHKRRRRHNGCHASKGLQLESLERLANNTTTTQEFHVLKKYVHHEPVKLKATTACRMLSRYKKHHNLERRWIYFGIYLIFVLVLLSNLLVQPTNSSSDQFSNSNQFLSPNNNKNSGQCKYPKVLCIKRLQGVAYLVELTQISTLLPNQVFISQLCATKSQFPVTKRIEGAVLSSNADTDVNCTITFRTKSAHQHFVIRFEELRLGCDDHLKMFDGDLDYGQPSIKDFSCRDSMASVPIIQTTGTFLTIRFSSDSKAKLGDGFKLVATAVFDMSLSDCPPDYAFCRNHLCISRSLFCDGINHCVDYSDESGCTTTSGSGGVGIGGFVGGSGGSSIFSGGELSLSNALGLLIVLVLVIFLCVIVFISAIYCRRENPYAQYQHHLQRTIGVPLQTSSSIMFANHQPQYHYFQPANMSPYITPQHHAIATTLPRGYSTLPMNLVRQPQLQASPISTKGNHVAQNVEHLLMAGLTGPPTAAMQAAPATQTSLYLPVSQSMMPASVTARAPMAQQQQQQQPPERR